MSWTDDGPPPGWKLRTLGEVTTVIGGGTPKTSVPGHFADDAGHPWITPADLTGYTEKFIGRGRRFLTDQGLSNSSATYLPAGSVLFSSRAPIGYVAIAKNPLTTNQGFRSLVPSEEIDSEYLYHVLRFLTPLAEELASGTTFAEISGSKLARLPIAYPALNEQRMIAGLLAAMDVATRSASEHLADGRRAVSVFRKTVLDIACSGRLTADWRASDVAGATAGSQGEDQATLGDQVTSNGRRIDPGDEARFDIPEGWALTNLGSISSRVTSGSRDWSRFYGHGPGTFVMAQNVRRGYLDWSFRQPVDPPSTDTSRERSQIRRGDLLVTIVGANTGDVGPVLDDRPEHYVCQSVALVRPVDTEMTDYLNLWFNSDGYGRGYFEECLYGAGRPHLSFQQLKASPVALPTPSEQREIVRRVKGLLDIASRLDAYVETASRRVESASQAALSKAFRGELAPPDSSFLRVDA
jgi:type I restriction enzyme, S subunit